MTDRIQQAFRGHKAFIPFLTCGDPDLETTEAAGNELLQSVYETAEAA